MDKIIYLNDMEKINFHAIYKIYVCLPAIYGDLYSILIPCPMHQVFCIREVRRDDNNSHKFPDMDQLECFARFCL